jgi:hypothetical protein
MAINGTKQYILNYDSKYLYPYTVLDAIIDPDTDETGVPAITNAIGKSINSQTKDQIIGNVLGIAINSDASISDNTYQLQKLGAYDSTNVNYKYKYFSQTGDFQDLPASISKITLTGIGNTGNVLAATNDNHEVSFAFDDKYFKYNNDTGLQVEAANKLYNKTTRQGRLTYFSAGELNEYKEDIGNETSLMYYNGNTGFNISTVSLGDNTAVQLNNGTFEKIDTKNLVAGKLINDTKISSSATKMAIPYVMGNSTTDNYTINYVIPESPSNGQSYALVYKEDVDEETNEAKGKFEWVFPNSFTNIALTDVSTNTDTIYYLTGVGENLISTGTNELAVAKYTDAAIYFKNGNLYNSSDERLKTFTDNINIDFDKLATIKKGIFYWNDDESKSEQIGVTAQSVNEIFPQIVSLNNGTYSVAYDKLTVIALAAIDELHKENEELKQRIQALESKLK